MHNPKWLRICAILVAIIFSIAYGLESTDFYVFLNAGARIKEHINVYTAPAYNTLQYFYSPLFALLLAPFSGLPFNITSSVWILFLCYLLYRIWLICSQYLDTTALPKQAQKWWVCLSLFYIYNMVMYNIWNVQMTIFLVWATLVSLNHFAKGKPLTGAALLAFIINVKILPVVFLPYLLYRRYFKAFAYTVVFLVVYLFLPAIFIGMDFNNELLHSWWDVINPSNGVHMIETDSSLHSLVSTIPPYLTETHNSLGLKINFIEIGQHYASVVCTIVRAALIILAFAFFRTAPFKQMNDKTRVYWEVSYLLLITPLIFPHQNKYSYFYVFPAFIYLTYFIMVQRFSFQRKNLALVIYLLIISIIYTPLIGRDILGNYIFDWLQLYRVQVICTVLFIPALLYSSPSRLKPVA